MTENRLHQFFTIISLVITLALLTSCSAASKAYKRGNSAAKRNNWDAAVVHYTRAINENPGKIEYRISLEHALMEAAAYHVQQAQKKLAAENLEGAIEELEISTNFDPTNKYAQNILVETRLRLREREALRLEATKFEDRRRRARALFGIQPILEPASTAPIQLKFAEDTSLQKIFEVLSKLSGINILFDEAFRDKRTTLELIDVSFEEALDKLVLINRLFYKVIDANTIIIIPENAQKHRQYDDLMLRTFYIVNADVNTVANMLRTIAGIQRVQPNLERKAITVRATADQIAVADRIVELNDKTKSEVMLDIEILEINRTKMLEYGLKFAEHEIGLGYRPAGSSNSGDKSQFTQTRLNRFAAGDSSDFIASFPSAATFRLFKSESEARLLASPKLRATEGQPAELRLGQEVPIPVTSFVSQFGTAGGIPTTPVTSFQYRNIGININITPKVFVDGEIELQLTLETSTQLETRIIGGIELPVFGTRTVTNMVRLRDGETNLIAGLINNTDRRNVSGLPGVVDIPLLNQIFANNDEEEESQDVVFSVTPHIVRAPRVTEADLVPIPTGTEQVIRVPGRRPFVFDAAIDRPFPNKKTLADDVATNPNLLLTEKAVTPSMPQSQVTERPVVETNEPTDTTLGTELSNSSLSILFSPPATTAAIGQTVEVVLIAGGADGLSAGEITVSFDPASLIVSEVQPGPFLTIDGRSVSFSSFTSPGTVKIRFSRPNDEMGLRGSGHLARITFEVVASVPTIIVSASGTVQDPAGGDFPASYSSMRIEVQQ